MNTLLKLPIEINTLIPDTAKVNTSAHLNKIRGQTDCTFRKGRYVERVYTQQHRTNNRTVQALCIHVSCNTKECGGA